MTYPLTKLILSVKKVTSDTFQFGTHPCDICDGLIHSNNDYWIVKANYDTSMAFCCSMECAEMYYYLNRETYA